MTLGEGGETPTVAAQPQQLTDRTLISLDYLAAPPALAEYVTTFYFFRCDEAAIRDVTPAGVGTLLIFLRGQGRVMFPGGTIDQAFPESLQTPSTAAAEFEVEGPFHCVGAALSPLGWAALTGLPAHLHCDRFYNAAAVLGAQMRELGDRLRARYASAAAGPAEMADELAAFITPRLRTVPQRHRALLGAVREWLGSRFNPPLAQLQAATGYSARQLQRLVERYYGVGPKHLVRKYRAMRVAALLGDPGTTDEQAAALYNLFYDQSHMIREIRLFAGRTPARLGDGNSPILDLLIDVRNFREVRPLVAPLPEG